MTNVSEQPLDRAEALDLAITSMLSVDRTLDAVAASHEAFGRDAAQQLRALEATTRSQLEALVSTTEQRLDSLRRQTVEEVAKQLKNARSDLSAITDASVGRANKAHDGVLHAIESTHQQVVDLFQADLERVRLDRRKVLNAIDAAKESVEVQLRATIQQSAVIAHDALNVDRERLRVDALAALGEERFRQRTYTEAEVKNALATGQAALEQRLRAIEGSIREDRNEAQTPSDLERRVQSIHAWTVILGIVVVVLFLAIAAN